MTPSAVGGARALHALLALGCAALAACAGATAGGGPVLTIAAAGAGRFDSNVRREPTGREAYGGSGELLVRAANRVRSPTLQLEYAVSARRSSLDDPNDGTGHRLNALAALPLTTRLRFDLLLRASRGGVDEDLVATDEAGLVSRLEVQASRALRVRGYGAQRWRELSAPEPALGRYAGVEVRHRVARSTTVLLDARHEQYRPADPSRNWDRTGFTLGLGQTLLRNTALELEVRQREREHPDRRVRVGEELVPREDRDLRFGAALVVDDGRGTELRLEAERDRRRSNDARRGYDADRVTLSVRRRVFAVVSGREPPRIDERPGAETIRRSSADADAGGPAFHDVHVAGTGVCAVAGPATACWPMAGQAGSTRPDVLTRSWLRIAAATGRACGLDADGAVWCWGWNRDVSAGTGAVLAEPAQVRTALRFVDLAVGGVHACGLTAEGSAFCWGENGVGQLGNGRAIPAPTPVAVTGGTRFRAIAAGGRHTCALDEAGSAWCWGANESGQSAAGPLPRSLEPRPAGGPAFTALTAGARHTCALTAEGIVWCWGDNAYGQLGVATPGSARAPLPGAGGLRFRSISAGPAHTCGIDAAGQAWCWGANRTGQLGIGAPDEDSHPQPRTVRAGQAFSALSASFRTCAIDLAGQVWCWGGEPAGSERAGRPRRLPPPGR